MLNRTCPRIALICPCYNEATVLPQSIPLVLETLNTLMNQKRIASNSYCLLVDDGSDDTTWSLITSLAIESPTISGIKLTQNRGHQYALFAGLTEAEPHCDAAISLDVDLQDDLALIEPMLDHFLKGKDIVFGVRTDRRHDTWFKRVPAQLYYRLLRFLGIQSIYNHADFRLMSRTALQALLSHGESLLYLRALVASLGFPEAEVYYARQPRIAGKSKYTWRKEIQLALDGITSFSVAPLRLIALMGFLIFLGSICLLGWVFYGYFIAQTTVPGWASTVLPIYFFGGLQLLALGIVGEYIAKILIEVKRRPRYIIEQTCGTLPSASPNRNA